MSEFIPNNEQTKLIVEYVNKYGPLTGFLPDGVENDQPEYADLLERMKSAGFKPSTKGWVPHYPYKYGDKVVFRNEDGNERVSTVQAIDEDGDVVINGTFGFYTRNPEKIRYAEDWEVHVADLNGGYLR